VSNELKKCCKETHLNEDDKKNLDQEVLLPGEPGIDHEVLNGYHKHGIMEAKHKAIDLLSSNGSIHKVKIRYKPKEVVAYFIESEHEELSKRKSKSGWLIPGLGRGVFYVPEEQFTKFFEFVENEGSLII